MRTFPNLAPFPGRRHTDMASNRSQQLNVKKVEVCVVCVCARALGLVCVCVCVCVSPSFSPGNLKRAEASAAPNKPCCPTVLFHNVHQWGGGKGGGWTQG